MSRFYLAELIEIVNINLIIAIVRFLQRASLHYSYKAQKFGILFQYPRVVQQASAGFTLFNEILLNWSCRELKP